MTILRAFSLTIVLMTSDAIHDYICHYSINNNISPVPCGTIDSKIIHVLHPSFQYRKLAKSPQMQAYALHPTGDHKMEGRRVCTSFESSQGEPSFLQCGGQPNCWSIPSPTRWVTLQTWTTRREKSHNTVMHNTCGVQPSAASQCSTLVAQLVGQIHFSE